MHQVGRRVGSVVARILAVAAMTSGVAVLLAALYFRMSGPGFFEGCSGDWQVWFSFGTLTQRVAWGAVSLTALTFLFLDRPRGAVSLICSLAAQLVLATAPHGVC